MATTKGEVFVWDLQGPSRPKAGVLRLPDEPLVAAIKELEVQAEAASQSASGAGITEAVSIITPLRSTGVRPFQSITCLGWSASGRLLFGGTTGGLVAVWDLCSPDPAAADLPLAVFKLPYPPRSIKPHPSDPTVLLIVTWTGMPYIIQWLTTAADGHAAAEPPSSGHRVQHASNCGGADAAELPSPFRLDCLYRLHTRSAATSSKDSQGVIRGGYAWRLPEMLLPPPRLKKAKQTLLKGAPVLRADACFRPSDGLQLFVATSRGDVVQLGLLMPSATNAAPRVVRLAHTGPAVLGAPLGVSPPEIHHSRHGAYLGVTVRSGIVCLSSEGGLAVVDRGYSEPVDNTPLVSYRLSSKDKYIVALPHERSGHMAGGAYFFRRGVLGSFKLRLGPAGGIASFDMHPRLGIFAGVTVRSQVYILAPSLHAVFAGPMFPPFFVQTLANKEYPEPEDEFDLVDASGRFRYHDRGSAMEGRGEPLFLGGGEASAPQPSVVPAPPETVAALPPVNILSDPGTLSRVVKQTQAQLLGGSSAPAASASPTEPSAASTVVLHGGAEVDLATVPHVSVLSPHLNTWWAAKEEFQATQVTGQESSGGAAGGPGQPASGGAAAAGGSKGSRAAATTKKKGGAKTGAEMEDGEPTSPVASGGGAADDDNAGAQMPAAFEDLLLAKLQPLPEGTVMDADTGIPADLLGLDTSAPVAFDLLPLTSAGAAPPLAYLLPCAGAAAATEASAPSAAALPSAHVPLLSRLHALLQLQPLPGVWTGLAGVSWAELPALASALVAGAAATGAFAPAVAAASAAAISTAPTASALSSPAAVTAYLRNHALSPLFALTVMPGWRSGELECSTGAGLADAAGHVLGLLQQEWRLLRLVAQAAAPGAPAGVNDEASEATAKVAPPAFTQQAAAVEAAAKAFLTTVMGGSTSPLAVGVPPGGHKRDGMSLPEDASPEPLAKRARVA